MPVYYYQGLPIQTPYVIQSNRQAYEVETLSLKRTTLLTEAQRWELSFSVVTNGDESALLGAHSWDYYGTKTMIMPQLPGVLKSYTFNTGTLAATSLAAAGQDTVVLTSAGMTGSATIPAGTFVKFAGHDKVYATKTSLTFSNAETSIQLKVFPNLLEAVPAAQTVQLGSDCVFRYKLDYTSMSGINISNGIITSVGNIKVIEAL